MPPPTGVVKGPLIPIKWLRNVSTVSSGSQLPVSSNAFWPARTSFQATLWPCLAAAASRTSLAAGQMSTPVPSPSMKGMMGSSGTTSVPSVAHADEICHGPDATGRDGFVPIDLVGRGRPASRSSRLVYVLLDCSPRCYPPPRLASTSVRRAASADPSPRMAPTHRSA